MKKALLAALVALVLVLAVMLVRAATLQSLQPGAEDVVQIEVDADALAARFAAALRYPTVSNQDRSDLDREAFLGLHEFLAASYPLSHATLARETVNELSLLYTWEGTDAGLDPVVLMGHLDVVPVIPGTEHDWQQPPFSGAIVDGEIWGRGALDDKSSVISIMEAVEGLVSQGYRPRRTIYLAFGHDEEVGGPEGAARIAATLADRGVEPFAFVLDEGGAIIDGMIPGVQGKVAIIGIAEKGFISLQLQVRGEGGHSSTPPEHTNIGILAAALTRLENDPFPARFDGAAEATFTYLASEMDFLPRVAFANLWLLRPVVARMMAGERLGAALVHTTTAVTMVNGGVKDNVLPIEATAMVNFRILPGETRETVTARVRETIADDRIQIRDISSSVDPSPVSNPESEAFRLLGKTLRQVAPDPDIKVAPNLVVGGTDAKYYSGRSPNVYRFLPMMIGADGLSLAHGTNERVAISSLVLSVQYMTQLIRNTDTLE